MSLDRQSIEKRDFPIGRRGYDPEAVDSHLNEIAAEVEELKLSAHRRTETLATSASDQVRAIVEAAEASAREIQAQAESEARAVRNEATDEATKARTEAKDQAHEYVSRVSEATAAMLQRLDAMESELSLLVDSLRTGANRLNADLQLLEGNFDDVRSSVTPRGGRFEPEPEPAGAGLGGPAPAQTGTGDAPSAPADKIVDDFRSADAADGTEDARLVALNMALDGTSREETDKYLAENFQVADRASLLDEVYASVNG